MKTKRISNEQMETMRRIRDGRNLTEGRDKRGVSAGLRGLETRQMVTADAGRWSLTDAGNRLLDAGPTA